MADHGKHHGHGAPAAAHAAPDAHAAHAAHHGPHVLPLKMYFAVWGALMVGTVLTVAASFVHIGPFNVPIMLLIAVTKAALVALFFMHLWYDEKFNLLVFLFGLVFVSIFFTFTLSDSLTRGSVDPREKHMILPEVERGAVKKAFHVKLAGAPTTATLVGAAPTSGTATAAGHGATSATMPAATPAAH